MPDQFKRHYSRDEAQELLPQIRQWLRQLVNIRNRLQKTDLRLGATMAERGGDLGGTSVNAWVRQMLAFRQVLMEFQRLEIQVKDIDRGLVDFPAIIGGKEVFLCWEQDEDKIEFWHDLDAGYAGRERI